MGAKSHVRGLWLVDFDPPYVNTRIYRDKTLASASGKCTVQVKIDDQWLLFTADYAQLLHVSREIIAIGLISELIKSATAFPSLPTHIHITQLWWRWKTRTAANKMQLQLDTCLIVERRSCTSHCWKRKSRWPTVYLAKAGVHLKVYGFKQEASRFLAFMKLASRKDLEV